MTLNYMLMLLHIKSSHPNFEVNRLYNYNTLFFPNSDSSESTQLSGSGRSSSTNTQGTLITPINIQFP